MMQESIVAQRVVYDGVVQTKTEKEKRSLEKRRFATELNHLHAQKVTAMPTAAELGALDAKILDIEEKIGKC